MDKIPLLLLAAGGSARMGQPKQLLPWGSNTLIEHQVQTLLKTEQPLTVVLGAYSSLIIPVLEEFPIAHVVNENWETGMGSSIAAGIRSVAKNFPKAEGVLIALIDQPLVTIMHYKKILQLFQAGNQQIVISNASSGQRGVPVVFDKDYFEELKNLNGKEGGKTIIRQHPDCVVEVQCGDILDDIDTPESYQKLLSKSRTIIN